MDLHLFFQCPTIMIARFAFPSDSINRTKVTFSLMPFRISKALFLLHIVILYLRFCSPFLFLLFDIIALEKLILFLLFSFSRVNDSSIIFTREVTDLLSLIQWKSDSKLLKQQLLDVFWQYFITGAAGWNCTFLVIYTLPIGTPNIWILFCIITPTSLIHLSIEIWFKCHELI